MSKYTTEVRFICESYCGLDESKGFDDVDTIVTNAANRIFESFPIFDEEYRLPLEKKILRHYYTREICAETVGLWKLWLNNRMNEIMPYYNQLYRSAMLELEPFNDVDYTVDHQGSGTTDETVDGTSSNTGTVSYTKDNTVTTDDDNTRTNDLERNLAGTSESNRVTDTNANGVVWEYFNDTPQGGVDRIDVIGLSNYLTNAKKTTSDQTTHGTDGIDASNNETETQTGIVTDERDIERVEHGTNVGNTTNNGTSETTRAVDSTNEYIERVVGKRNSMPYSELLLKFRQTFLNIDAMIIDELKDLFFNLW